MVMIRRSTSMSPALRMRVSTTRDVGSPAPWSQHRPAPSPDSGRRERPPPRQTAPRHHHRQSGHAPERDFLEHIVFLSEALELPIKQPNGQGIIEMAQFTPTMGNVFTQDFENTNPFWQFIPSQNGNGAGPNAGSFVSITPAAFNTAVGLVMQHVQSGIGWIAAANTTSHMSTSSSSSLFTASVTHKETANTAPVWTAVLPEGAAPGQQEGYLLPVPGSSASTPQAAVASLNVSQDAQTIGGLTKRYGAVRQQLPGPTRGQRRLRLCARRDRGDFAYSRVPELSAFHNQERVHGAVL